MKRGGREGEKQRAARDGATEGGRGTRGDERGTNETSRRRSRGGHEGVMKDMEEEEEEPAGVTRG